MTLWVGAPHGRSQTCQNCSLGSVVIEIKCFNLSRDSARSRDLRTVRPYRQGSLKVSYHPAEFDGKRHCGSGDNGFCLLHDPPRHRGQRVMWLYGWESLIVSHLPAKSGGPRYCDSGDIKFLALEKQNSTCLLKSAITVYLYTLTHEISERGHGYLPCNVNKSDIDHTRLM